MHTLFITRYYTCSVPLHYINYSHWKSDHHPPSESITARFPLRAGPSNSASAQPFPPDPPGWALNTQGVALPTEPHSSLPVAKVHPKAGSRGLWCCFRPVMGESLEHILFYNNLCRGLWSSRDSFVSGYNGFKWKMRSGYQTNSQTATNQPQDHERDPWVEFTPSMLGEVQSVECYLFAASDFVRWKQCHWRSGAR